VSSLKGADGYTLQSFDDLRPVDLDNRLVADKREYIQLKTVQQSVCVVLLPFRLSQLMPFTRYLFKGVGVDFFLYLLLSFKSFFYCARVNAVGQELLCILSVFVTSLSGL
jgi:hypothetical protein